MILDSGSEAQLDGIQRRLSVGWSVRGRFTSSLHGRDLHVTTDGAPNSAEIATRLGAMQQRLSAYFSTRVDDSFAGQELTSRVNERVLQRAREGGGIDDVERFAFGVARHVLHEYWREIKRRREIESTLSETAENRPKTQATTTSTAVNSRRALLDALRSCIDQLPDGDQEIARRCYGEGKSKENRAQVAEELGLTRNTLDVRISRLRVKLEACVRARLLGE